MAFLWILLVALMSSASAVSANVQTRLSTEGTKFIVYPSRVDSLWDRVQLYITTRSHTPVMVRIFTPMKPKYRGGVDISRNVEKGKPLVEAVQADVSSLNKDKLLDGIVVVSQDVITVFVNNPSSNASGVTSILGYTSLGTSYLFPSIKRTVNAQTSILIGNPDGRNEVTVTLPGGSEGPSLMWKNTLYGPGQSFKIVMNKNEFADIRQQDGVKGSRTRRFSHDPTSKGTNPARGLEFIRLTGSGDLTGTLVEGQNVLAVFCASVFYPSTASFVDPVLHANKDITVENIPPLSTWGRKFMVSATSSKSVGDYVRVMASEAGVTVTFPNSSQVTLTQRGNFFETEILPGDSFLLVADKPVLVMQYRIQFATDSAPLMFLVPALSSYDVRYTVPIIFDQKTMAGSENHLVLVTNQCHADRVQLNHDLDPQGLSTGLVSRLSVWERVENSDYVVARVKVGLGFVSINMLASDDPLEDRGVTMGGFFFGMGPNKAYAAALGLRWSSGTQVRDWPVPSLPHLYMTEQTTQGKSSLVTRDRRPLAFPLTSIIVQSKVACHHECWTNHNCFFVAYDKKKSPKQGEQVAGTRSSPTDKMSISEKYTRKPMECILYGPTAGCSGFVSHPGRLLYRLDKR